MDKLIRTLLTALIAVESGGNPQAVNERENAVGILQIRPIYLRDVQRISPEWGWTLADRWSPTWARAIVSIYLTHYGRDYERKTGKKATAEVLSRLHVSGPYNPNKKTGREWPKKSDEYWAKVQKALKAQEVKP